MDVIASGICAVGTDAFRRKENNRISRRCLVQQAACSALGLTRAAFGPGLYGLHGRSWMYGDSSERDEIGG